MISGAGSQEADGDGFPKLRGAVQLTSMQSGCWGSVVGSGINSRFLPRHERVAEESSLGETLAGEQEWVQGRAWGWGELRTAGPREGCHQSGQYTGLKVQRRDLTPKAPGACDKDSVW